MKPTLAVEEIFIETSLMQNELESSQWQPHGSAWKKQHELWRHGNELIANSKSRHDLEVAVMQLQRAVEQRDTILESLYRFKGIPWFPKDYSQYAVMADLGIIRPSLKAPLRELRNKILHEVTDAEVDREQCKYLSDTAWYYLKATDVLARQCATEVGFHCGEEARYFTLLEFSFQPGAWVVNVKGSIPDRHLLPEMRPDALYVKATNSLFENDRGVRHLKFLGSLVGSEPLARRVVRAFFDEAI